MKRIECQRLIITLLLTLGPRRQFKKIIKKHLRSFKKESVKVNDKLGDIVIYLFSQVNDGGSLVGVGAGDGSTSILKMDPRYQYKRMSVNMAPPFVAET